MNLFIVAHSSSIDSCTRSLIERPTSLPKEIDAKVTGTAYPYCCVLVLEENTDKSWTVVDRALPNLSYYAQSNRIDDKVFNRPVIL